MKRDGATISLWQESAANYIASNQPVREHYDVVIVGGGITGITAALQLQKAGKSCLLIEAHNIGFGTTGGTTAHLNTFFDTPYSKVIKNFNEASAQLLVKGAKKAIGLIKENIDTYKIDCSFEEREGYLFSTNEKESKELDDLVETTSGLGLPIHFTNDTPFPVPYLKVACIEEQAQFNPIEYIFALAKAFEEAGGTILQNCRVKEIKEGDVLEVATSLNTIKASNAIYATHIPPGVNLLHFRCAPYRSYAIGVKLKGDQYPVALGYDMQDPYHYYRSQVINGEEYLIAGGEDHKTGHEENTDNCFRRLESYVKSYFDVAAIPFRWSSQYFEPADGLPYIGYLPGTVSNIFVSTGYGGNGMIYGTLAGTILADIITTGKSDYQDLFNPNRVKPFAGFANFVKEGADVVQKLIGGLFSAEKLTELADLAPGEAKVVKYEGHTLALYKDENHRLHAVNAACTHIKCTVGWNSAEKSWDCPCHGSRFSYDGEMLTAPARVDLEKGIDKLKDE